MHDHDLSGTFFRFELSCILVELCCVIMFQLRLITLYNKAGYTAVSRVRLGRGSNAQKSTKKLREKKRGTDRPTDGPTDGHTLL